MSKVTIVYYGFIIPKNKCVSKKLNNANVESLSSFALFWGERKGKDGRIRREQKGMNFY
jgi:hypothetical protein